MNYQSTQKPIKYIQAMGSPAHTYGNALAFIQKWLTDCIFPKRDNGESIFKTIHVSSKLAHRQLRSTSHEMGKKMKPIIALKPRVDFQDDRFLQGTPLVDRMMQSQLNFGKDGLQTFFFDRKNKIAIKYQLNRSVMYVDVVLIFSTLMQQINYATYLKNNISVGHPFSLRTCFESYLSHELMETVAELAGIPLMDDSGSVAKFLRYMNQNSVTPVTYKLQGSTNSNEFYRYYPVNIDMMIPSFDPDDGEKTEMITDNFQISFPIRMEFYTTGFYFLFSDNIFEKKPIIVSDDSSIIPIFTDVVLREDWDLAVGWNQYTRVSAKLEKINDIINFKEILSPSIVAAVKYSLDHRYSTNDVIEIKIRKQGNLLENGIDFTVDFSKFDIRFNNSEYGYYTYTIMVCINIENINNIIKDVYSLK